MAAPAPAGGPCKEKKVIDVTVVKVKPKYMTQYKQGIPSGAALWQKHGAKIVGIYLTEAGPGGEVIYISEWPTIDGRLNAYEKIKSDPEYQAMAERAKFIYSKETYLCYARSGCPMKPFNPNERVVMKKFNLHGSPYLCENKFMEMVCYRKDKDPNASAGPLCVLHPVTASQFGMIVFFAQPGNSIDAGLDKWYKFVSDAKNWPKLAEAYTKYTEKSCRILAPFKA